MDKMGIEEFKLQQHHIGMIRINTSQRFVKGKPQILFDFLDLCDQLSCLLWYHGTDPFRNHDFNLAIPNRRTRAKIASNILWKRKGYGQLNLGQEGMIGKKHSTPKIEL